MRKTIYNFLREKEFATKNKLANFTNEVTVSNNSNFFSIKKWVSFLLIMALSFSANAQMDVTSSGGTASATYSTLRDAFNAINAGTHTGVIGISVTASTSEPGMDSLISSGTGAASYSSIIIKPATGVSATISGAVSGSALVKLCGADNVTFDGSNASGGTTRDLTINNTAAAASTAVIWLGGLSSNGATNNTVKNCNITGANRILALAGIISSSNSAIASASLAANSNNTYQNNAVSRASNCITLLGFGTSPYDAGVTVRGNNIDSSNAAGILMSNQSGYNVFENIVDKASNLTSGAASVIAMSFTNAHLNGNIYSNKILFVRQNNNTGANVSARGISLGATTTASNLLIYNNFIGNVHTVTGGGSATGVIGLGIMTAGSGYKIYNNTVNISTAPASNSTFIFSFYVQTTATVSGLDVRNNIFANSIASAANGGVGQNYAFYSNSTATNLYSNFDNNDFSTNFSNIAFYGGAARATLAALQAVDSRNTNSVAVAPTFTSSTDLHLSLVAGNALLNNGGTPVAGVTTDIDGATRSVNFPDIGADEIVYTPKISGFTPASACAGSTVTINGADFTGTSAITLAGVNASSYTVVSTSQVTAVVAGGYSSPVTGVITLTNASGSATSSSSLTRLAPGTFSSKSLSTGSEGDQVLINGANLSGATAVTFNGTTASFSITSSTEVVAIVPVGATTGNILVTDVCGNSINAGSFTVVAANPCSTPASQATSFVASSTTTSSLNGTFTAAAGSPSGYIVVYSTSALSGTPQNGTTYTAGGSLGGGIIKQVSASTSVSLSSLTGNTAYIVTVFAFNGGGCTGGPLYNTTSPLEYNFVTCPSVPTSVLATAVGDNTGNSINFTWGIPTGGTANSLTYTLEVTSDAGYTSHVSGSPYTTSSLSQSVSGLNINTRYYYRIKANNGCSSIYVSSNKISGCGAGTILPYTENFDAVIAPAVPSCWTMIDNNADGVTWHTAGVNTGVTGQSNPNVLRYNRNTSANPSTTIAADDWAVSPGFKLTGGVSYTMSFGQGTYSNNENLEVKYGTAATVAGLNAGTLYNGTALVNQAFVTQVSTFTPTSSGVYYFGFHCYSPSQLNGAIFLYVDNFRVEATPPPPTAPSSMTFTAIGSSSITVNWTDNSSTEVGFNVYSSLDGVTYTLQNTVGAGVTSSTVGNLNSNTQYFFKVTSYNYGGESSNLTGTATTADCGGIFTTNTYVGTFVAGQVKDWNLGSNWSLGHAPLSCENVVINANNLGDGTSPSYLYLNANASMNNLTITGQNTPATSGARQALFVYTNGYNMLINGNLLIANDSVGNAASVNDNLLLIAGGATGNNVSTLTVNGTTTIGNTGNRLASLGGASGFANIILRGDVVLGPQAFLNYGSLVYYIFDKNGNQTLTTTSTQTDGSSTYGLGNMTIGNTNNTTLTLAGIANSPASAVVGDFLINSGSTLIMPDATRLNRTVFGGSFTLSNNSTLKVGGSTGGVGNSNFPNNFSSFSVANSSTVEYNGTVAQDIASSLPYGNLIANNNAGLTLGGNTSVNTNLTFTAGKISTGSSVLTLGSTASISGVSSTRYINGKLAKTIGAATSSKLFEIGDATTYTPTTINFNGGATNSGGIFTASTVSGAHPGLGFERSGISSTNYLNRYYTLMNSGITGYTSITPSFTYAAGDIIGAANNSNFKVSDSAYGGGWSILTTTNPTSTSTNATGVDFNQPITADFVIGDLAPVPAPAVDEPNPTSACEGANYIITGSNFYGVTGIMVGATNISSFTVNSPTQITIAIPVGASSGVLSVTNSNSTATSAGSLTVNAQPQTTVSNGTQTICSGDAISTMVVGNSGSLSVSYAWTRTGTIAGGTNGASGNSDISGTLVNATTIPVVATYAVVATSTVGSCVGTTATATVTVKASPGSVSVTPGSANICQTAAQPFTATVTAATGSSVTNSGAITVGIPDNNIAGANTILNVSNIPTGAIITGIDVGFSINHTFNSDIAVNLTAPNGKTLNLAYQVGGSGKNFLNTVISSTGVDFLPLDSTDNITGTYAADGFGGVGASGLISNVSSFSGLYSVTNGNWRLSARDYFNGDAGTITNWNITIYYTLSPTFNWAPQPGLYTDAGFTAYSGGSQSTVYAKNVPGVYKYNAKITFLGCAVNSDTITVDVDATPIATRSIASQTICSGSIAPIVLGTSNGVTGTTFAWTRDNTANISGTIGASGSGDISGTLINNTSSPITVTFTITPTGPGATACPGAAITANVTINPTPLATATPLTQNSCSGSAITPIIFGTSNNVSGTGYAWTRDNTSAATGIAASGSSFVSGILTNASTPTTVTFSIVAVGPGASACAGTPATATVTISNPASVYTVTGGGHYCSPGAGLPVGLTNAQSGYNYQLLLNGSPLGSPMTGTGAISFGNQTSAGTYTVLAQNAGCSTPMTGSAVITTTTTVMPSVSLLTSNTTVCGGTNVSFFAVATNGGTNPNYEFFVNGVSKQSGTSNVYITSTLTTGALVICVMTTSNVCQTFATSISNEIEITVNGTATLAAPTAITGSTVQCTIGGVSYLACATPGGVWTSSNTNVATISANGKVIAISNGTAIISYTISGSGCTNSSSVIFTVAQQTTPSSITGGNVICKGSTVALSNATVGGVWSSLNNAATVSSTGVVTGVNGGGTTPASIRYTVTNAAGCSKYVSYSVTVNALPNAPSIGYASGTQNPQLGIGGGFCINKTFGVVGTPTSAGSFWSSSNTNVMTVTSSGGNGTVRLIALGSTNLTYNYVAANGCSNSRTIVGTVVNCPVSRGVDIVSAKPEIDFTLYPNPAKNIVAFTTEFVEVGGQIIVTDMFGKQVRTQALSLGTNQIDVSKLSKGFYLVSMITNDGKKTKKLIVE